MGIKFIPKHLNQVIPENLRGEKEVFDTEKYIKSLIDIINVGPLVNENGEIIVRKRDEKNLSKTLPLNLRHNSELSKLDEELRTKVLEMVSTGPKYFEDFEDNVENLFSEEEFKEFEELLELSKKGNVEGMKKLNKRYLEKKEAIEAKEKFKHIMNDDIIHKISMEDNIVKESNKDNIFLSDLIKAMNPTQRQFNYDTFIKNVLKDLLNDKMFLITYNLDIKENTIVFEGFNQFTGELLWTTYLDLFALESDEVALFSNIDIFSPEINPSHIFKRKASVASFLEFYRNI